MSSAVFDTSDVENLVVRLETSLRAFGSGGGDSAEGCGHSSNTVAHCMIRQTDVLRDIIHSGDSSLSNTLREYGGHLTALQQRCLHLQQRIAEQEETTKRQRHDATLRKEQHARSLAHSELLSIELEELRNRKTQLLQEQEQLKTNLQGTQKSARMKMQTYHQATRVKFTGEDGDTVYAVFTDVGDRQGEPNTSVPLELSRSAKEDLVQQADDVWRLIRLAVQRSAAYNNNPNSKKQ
eukprot:Lankesteria_metandrocarpae@DN1697_c0_g1_i2.p1